MVRNFLAQDLMVVTTQVNDEKTVLSSAPLSLLTDISQSLLTVNGYLVLYEISQIFGFETPLNSASAVPLVSVSLSQSTLDSAWCAVFRKCPNPVERSPVNMNKSTISTI